MWGKSSKHLDWEKPLGMGSWLEHEQNISSATKSTSSDSQDPRATARQIGEYFMPL